MRVLMTLFSSHSHFISENVFPVFKEKKEIREFIQMYIR
jgi:hypothetical protein